MTERSLAHEERASPATYVIYIRRADDGQRAFAARAAERIVASDPAAQVEIVDVASDPWRAERDHVEAIPTIFRHAPLPAIRVVGEPSGEGDRAVAAALDALGIVAPSRAERGGSLPDVLDALGSPVLLADAEDVVVFANVAATAALGRDVLGVQLQEVGLAAQGGTVRTGGEAGHRAFRVRRERARWKGEEVQLVELQDVTREERVKAEGRRNALVRESVEEGIWDWDVARDRVHYSESFARMLEVTPTELGGDLEGWRRHVHPADEARFVSALRAHRFGATQRLDTEIRIVRPDGSARWIRVRAVSERDPRGRSTRVVGRISDVTDQKQREADLREAQERYRSLADHVREVVLEVDPHATIRYASPSASRSLGIEPAELVGRSIYAFASPAAGDALMDAHSAALAGRSPAEAEVPLLVRGSEVTTRVRFERPTRDGPGGDGFILVLEVLGPPHAPDRASRGDPDG